MNEDDLWFLPGDDPPEAMPLPRAPRARLFPLAEWRGAEADLAPDLAALAFDFGRLEERLRRLGPGARHRLALQEVSAWGWWTGDRLAVDRLVLWTAMQIGAVGEDAQALARGGWAVRRLTSGPAPLDPESLAALLGRAPDSDGIQDAAEVLDRLTGLHPATRAAALFQLWRLAGEGPAQDVEAAVLAARMGGGMAGQGAFLPLALTGFTALAATGDPSRRLAGWMSGAHQAVLAALMLLDRLDRWAIRARGATRDLSGRTPEMLLTLLMEWPGVSAPMAEAETGASRAAVQRNLDLLTRRGLLREVTGQGRYRIWCADL